MNKQGGKGRKFMISDIHGCVDTFIALLNKINFAKNDELYLLGDFIDRGLNSKGVFDHIFHLIDEGYHVFPIRGNHEEMLINNYNAESKRGWQSMADEEFLKSFNISDLNQLDKKYISFCKGLEYFRMENDFIVVHAGLNFNNANPLENRQDLLWIRQWYDTIDYGWLKNKIIIHGHTPQSRYEIEAQFNALGDKSVLNIDCGASLSKQKKHGLGHLCAFDFTNQKLIFQENVEINNNY